jgi:hypothetical protein
VLTDKGWEKIVATAPGHVETVRKLVIDPLNRGQLESLREIGQRIHRRIDPNTCV